MANVINNAIFQNELVNRLIKQISKIVASPLKHLYVQKLFNGGASVFTFQWACNSFSFFLLNGVVNILLIC